MDAETQDEQAARFAQITERLTAIEARLDHSEQEFARIRWVIEGYAVRQDKHNEALWRARYDADLKREALFREMDALVAEVALMKIDVAALRQQVNDAQQPRTARTNPRRRADSDH